MSYKRSGVEALKIKIENGQKQYIRYNEGAELYSMAALFNAGSTMGSYYKAMVNYDMPQFAG